MGTIFRIVFVVVLILGSQACSTSGAVSSVPERSSIERDVALSIGEVGIARSESVHTPSSRELPSTFQSDTPPPLGEANASPGSTSTAKGDFVPAVAGLPPDPGPARTYRIGPHDLLQIEVFQVEELSSEERVSEQGQIVMPLIGAVTVGGLTPSQAEGAIQEILGRNYLQNPQVNLFVKEYASQQITVTGSVEKPGVFPLTGSTTLLQAIAMAQGVDKHGDDEEVIIFRPQAGGGVKAYVVNLGAIKEGQLTDPVLVAGDRVVVPESGSAVFMDGAVRVLSGWLIRVPFL